jgi:hypothetical protein
VSLGILVGARSLEHLGDRQTALQHHVNEHGHSHAGARGKPADAFSPRATVGSPNPQTRMGGATARRRGTISGTNLGPGSYLVVPNPPIGMLLPPNGLSSPPCWGRFLGPLGAN